MYRRVDRLHTKCKSGMTLVEVLIALSLMLILSIFVVGGMIAHGRMAQSNYTRQKLAESARRFMDLAQTTAVDATEITVEAGPSGANTVLTIRKPDSTNPGAVLIKQFAYMDTDSNSQTIANNFVLVRDADTPNATTGKRIMENCSPVASGTPVFSLVSNAAKTLVSVNLRLGDRTNPPSNADNAITGRGYQSFVINGNISAN